MMESPSFRTPWLITLQRLLVTKVRLSPFLVALVEEFLAGELLLFFLKVMRLSPFLVALVEEFLVGELFLFFLKVMRLCPFLVALVEEFLAGDSSSSKNIL